MVRSAGFEEVREHGRFRLRLREGRGSVPHAVVHASGPRVTARAGARHATRGASRGGGVVWAECGGGPRLMPPLRKWWVMPRTPQVRCELSEPVHFGPGF